MRSWWKFVFVLLFVAGEVIALLTTKATRSTDATAAAAGTTTPTPDDDYDDEDDSDEDTSSSTGPTVGAGKIYKNPRNSPSPLCPRDEEQATLLGQKCLRKCSSDEDCKSKKKKCLCDGACGMSCIKPDRECPDPEQIPFGTVTATGKLFGSRATYSCQHGYHVVGLQSRTCQADGKWAGQPPACKQNIYCLQPPTIDHARHNALPEQATFDLDFTLQYYCHTGYVTNGFPRAKCLAIDGHASWYGPDITCEPRSCGPPPEIAHGWHAGECYTFGCRAAYRCADGYELVGRAERLCQADGTWTPRELPACVLVTAVQCPPPENPRHGKAIYTSCSYNSVVRYECDYGYTLVGESTRRCGADKKWSGNQPTCKEINCGHPGRLWNGWLENIDRGTGLGASIIFRCHHGMKLDGNSSSVCQIDGKWSYPLPKCLAPCVVPKVTKGRVILISRNDSNETAAVSTLVEHGQVLTVDCEPKFEFLTVHSEEVMCNNGTWTQIPKCEPAKCQSLPKSPRHGMVSAPEMKHGMKAKFRCKDGYQLKGEDTMECSFGNWTGVMPKCEEVYCPYPGMVQNGKILLVGNMGLYDYRSYVKKVANNKQIMYDCDKGYVLAEGPPGATCVGGRWSPRELPKCLPGEHPRFRWNRRKRSLIMEKYKRAFIRNYQHIYNQREKRFVHNFLNEPFNTYKSTGYYSTLLTRVPRSLHLHNKLSCHFPFIFPNGRISIVGHMGTFNRKVFNNQKIVFGCKEGYVLEGPKMAMCLRGKWTPRISQRCLLSDRPSRQKRYLLLPFPQNLPLVRSKRSSGFNSSNHSPEHPAEQFEKMLSEIFHGGPSRSKRALKGGSSTRTVSLGHRGGSGGSLSLRRGNKNRNQFEDDQDMPDNDITSTKKPKQHKNKGPCEPLQTEPFVNVEIVKHGKDQNETYGGGTVVKLACGKGYGLNLPENRTAKCVRGRWRPTKPMCVILPCFVPTTEHGIFMLSKSESSVNSSLEPGQVLNETMEVSNEQEVDFVCDEGYSVQGPSSLRCWHGDWVGSYPECTPAPCQLPKIYNGQYMSGYRAGLTIANGSSVTYQCDNDYSQSSKEVECFLGRLNPPNPSCSRAGGVDPDVLSKLSTKTHYLGGTDIVKGGDITVIEYGSSTGKPCGPPAKVRGSLIYRNGEPLVDDENNFPDGSEVTFNCIESIMGEKTTWKIICEDGSWIGRSLNCDSEELMAAQTVSNNSTCIFRNQEPNVISFYNDQQIREDIVEFPAGALLVSRCIDIGKYAMIGPNKRRCMGGEWDGPKPSCYGLNQENDYSMEKPPTILFRHQLGPIAQSNDGKLIVYPGTILHMECLWIRRFGVPKWNVSHDYRKYPEGWTTDPGRDSQLEYRLSILHAAKDDSGLFTCVTPARYTHSVEIIVKAVHCPAIPQRRGLTSSTQNTKMNTRVKFYCVNGNALIGAAEIVCLPSGNWSAPFPVCESIECGEVGAGGALPPRVRALVVSREVGGRAVFSCEPGFGLRGASETVCQPNGEWATPFPTCEEVHCDPPTPPENGYIQGSGPYKAGDVVQFNCNPDFMMEGQPIIACQETSRWSGKLPKCIQACSYPGTTISGRMSSVKFYYKIGENITFTCEEGLLLKGAAMLKCLKNGKWSNAIPTCITDPNFEKNKRHITLSEDY